jgi:hypothetical protein
MFCRTCYTLLPDHETHCPKCRRAFVAGDPVTYLATPFPPPGRILWHLVLTTLLAAGAAVLVSVHQMVYASGH